MQTNQNVKKIVYFDQKIKSIGEKNFYEEKEVNNHEIIETDRNGQYKTHSSKGGWFTKTSKIRLWAILFGPFYYIYKGLWKKGLLLYVSSLLFGIALAIVTGLFNWNEDTFATLQRLFLVCLYGKMGPSDVSRKEYSNEMMWKELPSIFSNGIVVVVVTIVAVVFNSYLTA